MRFDAKFCVQFGLRLGLRSIAAAGPAATVRRAHFGALVRYADLPLWDMRLERRTMSSRYLQTALGRVAMIVFPAFVTPVTAQWLSQQTSGIPRNADGKPNLTAPAPRASDGKPDLTGLWSGFTGD